MKAMDFRLFSLLNKHSFVFGFYKLLLMTKHGIEVLRDLIGSLLLCASYLAFINYYYMTKHGIEVLHDLIGSMLLYYEFILH